jgi:hypothetical protein
LGAILVPHDWLLLASGQTAAINVAAVSHARDIPHAHLRAWFEGSKPVEAAMPLSANQRVAKELKMPFTSAGDTTVLHVALTDGDRELWKKEIRTMSVAQPPRWPAFAAVETKLRYDARISVKDPKTGALSLLDYDGAWDPQLHDVVVFLPNGSRFVFWRGASYAPFWAGAYNTGVSYEWAESPPPPGGFDSVEPLADKELRYGRVRIVQSTASRIHVRWTYQPTDFHYKVWGDQVTEDYFFYPDGFGTRVVTLTSAPGADYELSELIVLTPRAALPLEILPSHMVDVLSLDGEKKTITFPFVPEEGATVGRALRLPKVANPRRQPMVYRILSHKDERAAAIYFSPRDIAEPYVFHAFQDGGEVVTPVYWGDHWPLGRGKPTGGSISDRIYTSPAHNSLMTWGLWSMGNRPTPVSTSELPVLDALGRSRTMATRRWAWLIAKTEAPDELLLQWAQSYSDPPALEVRGARIDVPSYSPERRAIRLVVESPIVEIKLKSVARTVNPVFELDHAPKELASVTIDGKPLPAEAHAWDGVTLWMKASLDTREANISLRFR